METRRAPVRVTLPDAVGRVVVISGKVAALGIVVLAFLITFDVVGRYVLKSPIPYTDEISAYLLVLIVFLGAAYLTMKDGHIRCDVITRGLPLKVRVWVESVTGLLSLGYGIVITSQSIELVSYGIQTGRRVLSTSQMYAYLPQLFIPIGCILLGLQLAIQAYLSIDLLRRQRKGTAQSNG